MTHPIRSQRRPMPKNEREMRDKRVATAIRSGLPIYLAKERFGLSADRIREICAKHNVATPTAEQSKWYAPNIQDAEKPEALARSMPSAGVPTWDHAKRS